MRKKSFQKSAENPEKSLFSMKNRVFMVVDEVWTQCGRSVAVKKSRKAWNNFEKDSSSSQTLFSFGIKGGTPPWLG